MISRSLTHRIESKVELEIKAKSIPIFPSYASRYRSFRFGRQETATRATVPIKRSAVFDRDVVIQPRQNWDLPIGRGACIAQRHPTRRFFLPFPLSLSSGEKCRDRVSSSKKNLNNEITRAEYFALPARHYRNYLSSGRGYADHDSGRKTLYVEIRRCGASHAPASQLSRLEILDKKSLSPRMNEIQARVAQLHQPTFRLDPRPPLDQWVIVSNAWTCAFSFSPWSFCNRKISLVSSDGVTACTPKRSIY